MRSNASNFRRKAIRIRISICLLVTAALLFSACQHPWRLAANPNPIPINQDIPDDPVEKTDYNTETEVTDTPEPTVTDTEPPATEAVVTDTPIPEDTPAPNDSSEPSSTPTATPTATPAPTPTPKPTPTPTPTPKPADIPAFSGPTINGHGTITNSIFASNRVTMVNVWATTCAPCIQELPHIQQLYNTYSSRGFKVVTVLGDSEQSGMIQQGLNIINAIGFTLPVMRNNSSVAAAFPAGAYPTTYFIDSNGNILKVVTTSHSYDEWVSILNQLGIS